MNNKFSLRKINFLSGGYNKNFHFMPIYKHYVMFRLYVSRWKKLAYSFTPPHSTQKI